MSNDVTPPEQSGLGEAPLTTMYSKWAYQWALEEIARLRAALEEAENALRSALEDCHPSVEAYFKQREDALPSDGSWFTVREYRLCVEYGDGRTVYKPLPPKISKSAAFTHAENYTVGKSGVTVSVESRVVSAWHHESLTLHKRDK